MEGHILGSRIRVPNKIVLCQQEIMERNLAEAFPYGDVSLAGNEQQ